MLRAIALALRARLREFGCFAAFLDPQNYSFKGGAAFGFERSLEYDDWLLNQLGWRCCRIVRLI